MTRRHPALPPAVSRPWLVVAATVWLVTALIVHRPSVEPVPAGQFEGDAVLATDVVPGRFGPWALAETGSGVVLLDFDEDPGLVTGDRVRVEGVADGRAGVARGKGHGSTVEVRRIERLSGPASAPVAVGNAVRSHVMEALQPFDDGRALLAGFLIGDTTHIDRSDMEAMRLAGLTHLVAVSGSNIALFLGLLAMVAGPLTMGPRRRAVIGLIGLPIYAAATRFEPSVMRASAMAGIALVGRLLGVVFEAWQLLAAAVTALLVLDPSLSGSAGFQLSVAATCGVLAGGRWPVGGGMVQRALAVTIGAQMAVAPLLLIHFGSIPLLSPLINLVAGPLVAAATVIGAIGVAGVEPLTAVAAAISELVIHLARGSSIWPQVTVIPLTGVAFIGLIAWRWRAVRPLVAMSAAGLMLVWVVGLGGNLPEHGVVVLDVGQGDAILVSGGQDQVALVDGGPDPVILVQRLRHYGVSHLDLVVMTHGDADHAAGLAGLVGRYQIGELWVAMKPHETPSATELLIGLEASGVPINTPKVGQTRRLGSIVLEVEGPLRRYESGNDQSIVITVRGRGRTMLLTGDIQTFAQQELSGLNADVLKVPHHGGGTSDPDWLTGVGADIAVISVGSNDFGHPVDWVIEVLEESGASVARTDRDGDVIIDLNGSG